MKKLDVHEDDLITCAYMDLINAKDKGVWCDFSEVVFLQQIPYLSLRKGHAIMAQELQLIFWGVLLGM